MQKNKVAAFLKAYAVVNAVCGVLLVLFVIAEAATVTLVSLWFAVGAVAAMAAALLGASAWVQFGIFALVSTVLLLLLRPLVRRYVTPKLTATNADSVIGTVGLVTVAIDNTAGTGQVKLGGLYWTARSTTGAPIPLDAQVRVDRISGVKVYVTPVTVSAPVSSPV